MTYTRSEILSNRMKWINYLLSSEAKKTKNVLDRGNNERCCLGHGCFILGIERSINYNNEITYENHASYPPPSFINMVGLWNARGTKTSGNYISFGDYEVFGLSALNDNTEATPQEIGAYLLSVVEGGVDTPFKPLSDYYV